MLSAYINLHFCLFFQELTSDGDSLADISLSSLLPPHGASLPELNTSSLLGLEPDTPDLEPPHSSALTDFRIEALLAKANYQSSEDEERPVDYSTRSSSEPSADTTDSFNDDDYEAPLSPCITDSPQKLGKRSDSGYLSSAEIASPPHTDVSQRRVTLQTPSQADLNYLHSNWSAPIAQPTTDRPADSYTTMIGHALMSVPEREMVLADIYAYIMERYPYYKTAKSTWKSTIRHNLSTMDCFVRGRKARSGRGYYWGVHPDFTKNFEKGFFSRRQAQQAAQQTPKSSVPSRPSATAPYSRSSATRSRSSAVHATRSSKPTCSPIHPVHPAQRRVPSSPYYSTMTSTPVQQSSTHHQKQQTSPAFMSAQQRFAAMQAQCAQLLGYQQQSYINYTVGMDMRN